MAYFTTVDVRQEASRRAGGTFSKAESVLRSTPIRNSYDIFLSHSFKDAELILGVKLLLEKGGQSVYVDWIEDSRLDRTKVDASTAALLRKRMGQSQSFVYAYSTSSIHSKWMPWELGYFDGLRDGQSIAIMPLTAFRGEGDGGQEYLGLYAHIERQTGTGHSPIIKSFGGQPPRSVKTFAGKWSV